MPPAAAGKDTCRHIVRQPLRVSLESIPSSVVVERVAWSLSREVLDHLTDITHQNIRIHIHRVDTSHYLGQGSPTLWRKENVGLGRCELGGDVASQICRAHHSEIHRLYAFAQVDLWRSTEDTDGSSTLSK